MSKKLILILISALVFISCKNEHNTKQVTSKVENKAEKESKDEAIKKSDQKVLIAVNDSTSLELRGDLYYPVDGEVTSGGKNDQQLSLNIKVNGKLEVVSDAITNEMNENGWKNAGDQSAGNARSLIFKKPGRKVSYVVSRVRSNQCNVTINVFEGL